jgi:hypothetical protein
LACVVAHAVEPPQATSIRNPELAPPTLHRLTLVNVIVLPPPLSVPAVHVELPVRVVP